MRWVKGSCASTRGARRPRSLLPLMKCCACLGGNFSSSMPMALITRLTTESWSAESRIWKVEGNSASRWWARSRRLQRPWKVPTHMPRVLMGSMAEMRVSISRAALLVKVTARMPCGLALCVATRKAMRVVRTRVLPLPAPARISAERPSSVTASCWCGLRPSRRVPRCMAPFYWLLVYRLPAARSGRVRLPGVDASAIITRLKHSTIGEQPHVCA